MRHPVAASRDAAKAKKKLAKVSKDADCVGNAAHCAEKGGEHEAHKDAKDAKQDKEEANQSCGSNTNIDSDAISIVKSPDACDCQKQCLAHQGCIAWTFSVGKFVKNGQNCWLKAAYGEEQDNCDGQCFSGHGATPKVGSTAQSCGSNTNIDSDALIIVKSPNACD